MKFPLFLKRIRNYKYLKISKTIFLLGMIILLLTVGVDHPSKKGQANIPIIKTIWGDSTQRYEGLNYQDLPEFEHYNFLITTSDNSKENIEKIARKIKEEECRKKCNIVIWDDRKAYDLDKERSTQSSESMIEEWDKANQGYIAEHLIGILEYRNEKFSYYPLKRYR